MLEVYLIFCINKVTTVCQFKCFFGITFLDAE
jgi:hypothetical protein